MKHRTSFLNKRAGLFLALLLCFLCLCFTASADLFAVPPGTERIEEEAFCEDTSLDIVMLSEPLSYIGRRAFARSSVRLLYLPESLTKIEDDILEGCSDELVCIAVPGSYAQQWCDGHGIAWCKKGSLLAITPAESAVILKNGAKQTLQPALRPAGTKARLVWRSSDPAVCTVDEQGEIFGNYPGQAVITVSAADSSASAQIQVTVQANYRAVLFSESTFSDGNVNRNRGDIRLMEDMLSRVTGPDGGKYVVSSFDDLVAAEVYARISELLVSPSRDGDVSLFFFASHGDRKSTSIQLAGRLFCKDRATWLELPTLAQELSRIHGKVIVLLESCGPGAALRPYANPFSVPVESSSAEAPETYDLNRLIIDTFRRADPGLVIPGTFSRAESNPLRPLPRDNPFLTDKFVVITAASYLQVSYMIGSDLYNLFPFWLTQGVGAGGPMPADTECGNSDGKLTVQELFKYVYKHTKHKQTPLVYPTNSDYVLFLMPQ